MATKKPAAKKKTTAKSVKTSASKKHSTAKIPKYETLKLTKKDTPFFTTRLTSQTFYWTLISILVLILGLWIINLQYDVYNLYERLNTQQAQDLPLPVTKKQ